jgi:hypothetical protein
MTQSRPNRFDATLTPQADPAEIKTSGSMRRMDGSELHHQSAAFDREGLYFSNIGLGKLRFVHLLFRTPQILTASITVSIDWSHSVLEIVRDP